MFKYTDNNKESDRAEHNMREGVGVMLCVMLFDPNIPQFFFCFSYDALKLLLSQFNLK